MQDGGPPPPSPHSQERTTSTTQPRAAPRSGCLSSSHWPAVALVALVALIIALINALCGLSMHSSRWQDSPVPPSVALIRVSGCPCILPTSAIGGTCSCPR
ncbi:hypothetical protein PMIN06_011053 [Paraphaeosphaeria minitans]